MACRDRGHAWSWHKSKKRIRIQTFLRISIRLNLTFLIYRNLIMWVKGLNFHMISSHSSLGVDPWAEWWLLKACLWLPTSPCRARAIFAPCWTAVVIVPGSAKSGIVVRFVMLWSVDSISQRLCLPFAAAATLLLAWPLPVKASLQIWQPID